MNYKLEILANFEFLGYQIYQQIVHKIITFHLHLVPYPPPPQQELPENNTEDNSLLFLDNGLLLKILPPSSLPRRENPGLNVFCISNDLHGKTGNVVQEFFVQNILSYTSSDSTCNCIFFCFQYLDLSHNYIRSLKGLQNHDILETIKLENNEVIISFFEHHSLTEAVS